MDTFELVRTVVEIAGGIFLGIIAMIMHGIRSDISDLRERLGRVEEKLME